MRKYVTKNARFASEQKLLLNVSVNMGKAVIEAAGKKYDAGAIKGLLQERLDATSKVDSLHIQYLQAVQEERDTLDRTDAEVAVIRDALLVRYTHDPEALAQLGLANRKKRKKMTGEEMVAMAAKAKATRNGHPAQPVATPEAPIAPPVAPVAPVVVNGSSGR